MRIFADASPLFWRTPSGISIQMIELFRSAAKFDQPITMINYLGPFSSLTPTPANIKWIPGARFAEEKLGAPILQSFIGRSEDHFLATSHFLPKTKSLISYFLYDLIRVIRPDLVKNSSTNDLSQLRQRVARADRVVVPSRSTALDLQRLIERDIATTILPAGVDVRWFAHPAKFSKDLIPTSPYIYTNGVVQPRKRFEWSFKLADHLKLPLICTGALDKTARSSFDAISASFPKVKSQHIGLVSREHQRLLYQNCEIFSFPTLYEGFGMPVLEAMASNAIILASRNSSIPEIVSDERQMFDTDDIDEFLHKATCLLNLDESDRARLKRRNFERSLRFDIDTISREFWKTFQ